MKRKIVLLASLLAGIVAAVLTRFYVAAKDAEVAALKESFVSRFGGTMDVLIYGRDIPAGTVLERGDLLKMEVPRAGLRGQALTEENLSDVVGRKTLVSHRRADIVFWADIEGGNPAAKGLSDDVKKTMRAISINCIGAASVSSMVRPNDHVDVIGTFDLSDKATGSARARSLVTCTLLQNVLVLATGQTTSKMSHRSPAALAGGYSTVTLEVTPREAEMLAFAEQIKGRLVLTLRNRNDTYTERELPNVDFEKIRGEIEELNQKRQQQKLSNR